MNDAYKPKTTMLTYNIYASTLYHAYPQEREEHWKWVGTVELLSTDLFQMIDDVSGIPEYIESCMGGIDADVCCFIVEYVHELSDGTHRCNCHVYDIHDCQLMYHFNYGDDGNTSEFYHNWTFAKGIDIVNYYRSKNNSELGYVVDADTNSPIKIYGEEII